MRQFEREIALPGSVTFYLPQCVPQTLLLENIADSRNLADPPKLLFKEVREWILRKCVPAKEKQMRIIFEKQP